MSAISTHSETAAPRSTPHSRRDTTRLVLAASIGNALECFDLTSIMFVVAVAALFTILPRFMFLNGYPTAAVMIAALAWIAIIKAGYAGALPALMAEIFPTQIRGTGMSLASTIAVTIFGGFSPFINSSLIQLTGSNLSPAFYIMMIAALSVVTLVILRRRGVAS